MRLLPIGFIAPGKIEHKLVLVEIRIQAAWSSYT